MLYPTSPCQQVKTRVLNTTFQDYPLQQNKITSQLVMVFEIISPPEDTDYTARITG